MNDTYIAAATDVNVIRLFTVGGLQYNMFSIPGGVVSMTMCSTQLFIVYHKGAGKTIKYIRFLLERSCEVLHETVWDISD